MANNNWKKATEVSRINSQHINTHQLMNMGPDIFLAIILRFITPFPGIQNRPVIKIKL